MILAAINKRNKLEHVLTVSFGSLFLTVFRNHIDFVWFDVAVLTSLHIPQSKVYKQYCESTLSKGGAGMGKTSNEILKTRSFQRTQKPQQSDSQKQLFVKVILVPVLFH